MDAGRNLVDSSTSNAEDAVYITDTSTRIPIIDWTISCVIVSLTLLRYGSRDLSSIGLHCSWRDLVSLWSS
jgi:hypothetical protein